jgi:hypothetical protein
VGEGETLGDISMKYLGRELDENLSKEILALNEEIKNPNLIVSGMKIRLPMDLGKQASENGIPGSANPAEHR